MQSCCSPTQPGACRAQLFKCVHFSPALSWSHPAMEQLFRNWKVLSRKMVCAELCSRASLFSGGSLPFGAPLEAEPVEDHVPGLGALWVPGKAALTPLSPVVRCQCPPCVISMERTLPDPREPFDPCHLERFWVRECCWGVHSGMALGYSLRNGVRIFIQEWCWSVHSGMALGCSLGKGVGVFTQGWHWGVHLGMALGYSFRNGAGVFTQGWRWGVHSEMW